ncbi:hypothetical protein AXK12_04845 [Cephaloticoccus capnophilus]|uniref:Uncharacterized protein n=1 Tax=Cephaloticoccus capnophilus TaxID=1548208 RepID=A0A139SM53_9BACT|nr:rod shape-determining protein MreD [Cephaloticoccus capnophilus]KXU35647.1 hypothetical protein AXK12_04845 [Cephaloticoccus capnophilus]
MFRSAAFFLFASLVLLWAGLAQLNHALSPLHLHLFGGGLYVVFAALRLPSASGLILSCLAGLWCDAASPIPFGTHLVLFALAHTLIRKSRSHLDTRHTPSLVLVALLSNAALWIALTSFLITRAPIIARSAPRLLLDLLLSEALIALIAPWFFALQNRLLLIARHATGSTRPSDTFHNRR